MLEKSTKVQLKHVSERSLHFILSCIILNLSKNEMFDCESIWKTMEPIIAFTLTCQGKVEAIQKWKEKYEKKLFPEKLEYFLQHGEVCEGLLSYYKL